MPQHDRTCRHHRDGDRREEDQRPRGRRPVERRAGQGGTVLGDGHDPPDTPARERAEQPAERVGHQGDHPAEQPEHRRRTDDRGHHEVGDDGDQADLAGDRRHQRRAGQLCRRRYGDRLGQPAWQPPGQSVAPRRGDQEDPGRRQDRQREPGRAGELRVEEQQPDHGCAEAAKAPVPATAPEPDQRHGAHRGGAHHARLGARQQHEADDAPGPDEAEPATPDAADAGDHQEEADDQRQVGAGHGRQVGQAGRAEVLGQLARHPGVVAVDQGRHQGGLGRRAVGDGVADRGPQRVGGAPGGPRPRHPHRRTARRRERCDVAVVGGSEPAGEAHPLAHGHPLPLVVAEDEHGLVAPHGDPHQHPLPERSGDQPRVARDRAGQGDEGTFARETGDRTVAHRFRPRDGHHADSPRRRRPPPGR